MLKSLVLLRPFEEAMMHLQGNGEDRDYAGTRGALWEVFVWMDVMGNNIDIALAALEVKGSGSEDEGNTESSCFKDSLCC